MKQKIYMKLFVSIIPKKRLRFFIFFTCACGHYNNPLLLLFFIIIIITIVLKILQPFFFGWK
jgi:hypothetical protein